MERLKILLCGDSFAADWSSKYHGKRGWPNLLAEKTELINVAAAGCSEYSIWKQLQSTDLNRFDRVIVSHTSPYRIYVKQHPIHKNDVLHKNSDLIYSDSVTHQLSTVKDWFENYFDLDYAVDIHQMIMKEINRMGNNILHLGHMEISAPTGFDFVNCLDLWKKYPGEINHYSDVGNKKVYERLLSYIE